MIEPSWLGSAFCWQGNEAARPALKLEIEGGVDGVHRAVAVGISREPSGRRLRVGVAEAVRAGLGAGVVPAATSTKPWSQSGGRPGSPRRRAPEGLPGLANR